MIMVASRVPGSTGIYGTGGALENVPGPLGSARGTHLPGIQYIGPVIGFPAPKQVIPAKKGSPLLDMLAAADKALDRASRERRAKKLNMPEPALVFADNMTAMIREVDWPLFHKKGKPVRPEDVIQQRVTNCALASILAALALTPKGRMLIQRMIKEKKGLTLTSYDGKDHFNTFQGDRKILSERIFTVKLPGKGETEVSDVFFTDESEPPNMIYMTSTSKVLWSSVIEKAYAAILGGYDEFSEIPKVVWKDVLGREPKFLSMQPGTQNFASDRDVIRQAQKASTEPMIAAISGKFHGKTVTGVAGKKLVLYDPFENKNETLSTEYLRKFMTVFYYDTL